MSMTSGAFDQLTSERLARITAAPNPRSWRGRFQAAKQFFLTLDQEAALDSVRNVLCVIGAATILADLGTMRLWLVLPCVAVAFTIWFLDYKRHF